MINFAKPKIELYIYYQKIYLKIDLLHKTKDKIIYYQKNIFRD